MHRRYVVSRIAHLTTSGGWLIVRVIYTLESEKWFMFTFVRCLYSNLKISVDCFRAWYCFKSRCQQEITAALCCVYISQSKSNYHGNLDSTLIIN